MTNKRANVENVVSNGDTKESLVICGTVTAQRRISRATVEFTDLFCKGSFHACWGERFIIPD